MKADFGTLREKFHGNLYSWTILLKTTGQIGKTCIAVEECPQKWYGNHPQGKTTGYLGNHCQLLKRKGYCMG